MRDTTLKRTTPIRRTARQSLLTLVREACDMLLLAHPSVVGGVTVSRTLDDGASAAFVNTMVLRLAEEYGVDADVTQHGSALTIRLSRNDRHIHRERSVLPRIADRPRATDDEERGT